ncbi:hypothetical protein G8770_18675 [Aestuariicella hydrocarbonica]|uniref:DoxX family membrane protein n=1 Tax=Pseudomaricurvus hydrocarbonicus TaxID=1470433 RepID=A0A9E5T1L6_9GAMM|nr:hypothetical protein [Aestuariicella hydrocarbonica]NHO67575.1 hypothetical protein [Aestuariicella hydrocarbonica]
MITPLIIIGLLVLPVSLAAGLSLLRQQPVRLIPYTYWGLGIAFMYFALGHVVKTDAMVTMLPPWVPMREALIYTTGLLELVIGLALWVPRWQRAAAKCAIAVFILFFPANVYAALNSIGLGGHQWGPVYLFIRAPLQLLLIGWACLLCLSATVTASSDKVEQHGS